MSKTAAPAVAPAVEKDCLCGKYEIVVEEFENENGEPDYRSEDTGCNARTTRDFAPGHDAKLKSLLISAGARGLDVRYNGGGSATTGSAENAARGFAFAYMVIKGIEAARTKAEVRQNRAAAKKTAAPKKTTKQASQDRAAALTEKMAIKTAAAPVVTETPTAPAPVAPATTRIKVGRWEYDATVAANGDATFTNKAGAEMVAVAGTYKAL